MKRSQQNNMLIFLALGAVVFFVLFRSRMKGSRAGDNAALRAEARSFHWEGEEI
jgi:hypothetical protein